MSEAKAGELLAALSAVVGAPHVLTDPAVIAGRLVEPRGLYAGRALAVVRPGSAAEVSAVVSACASAGVSIVPQGGNTGLVGGQTPDASGAQVLVSLQRLRQIREIDPLTDTMIVEAGVTLAEAQAAAEGARCDAPCGAGPPAAAVAAAADSAAASQRPRGEPFGRGNEAGKRRLSSRSEWMEGRIAPHAGCGNGCGSVVGAMARGVSSCASVYASA